MVLQLRLVQWRTSGLFLSTTAPCCFVTGTAAEAGLGHMPSCLNPWRFCGALFVAFAGPLEVS